MFWGCFTYDKKGPIYIYKTETQKQKKEAELVIERLNQEREQELRTQWELGEGGIARIGLRNRPGRKPQWSFTKARGKLIRDSKGGVDFWRYYTEVVKLHLLPFVLQCLEVRPKTLLLEDGAPCHMHHYIQERWAQWGIPRLNWASNSPDLNAIEPSWGHLKRKTSNRGAEKTVGALEKHL